MSVYLSFKELLLDFDRFSCHGGKQPLRGDCRNKDDVESCLCLMEMEDKQLNELLRLFFSFSSSGLWPFGSRQTAVILRDSGSMQLHTEPAETNFCIQTNLVESFNNFQKEQRPQLPICASRFTHFGIFFPVSL